MINSGAHRRYPRLPMRAIFSAIALLSSVVAAETQMLGVGGAEITQLGTYEYEAASSNKAASSEYRFVSSATTVPARKGAHFGFEYRLLGIPRGLQAPIRHVVIFPEGGVRTTTGQVLARKDSFITATIGNLYLRGYNLDEDWEVVPGVWTLQVWFGERKLAEQSFTLTKP
jgi:Domain of unknown function (DUF3859)